MSTRRCDAPNNIDDSNSRKPVFDSQADYHRYLGELLDRDAGHGRKDAKTSIVDEAQAREDARARKEWEAGPPAGAMVRK